jgi:hypothetical protein
MKRGAQVDSNRAVQAISAFRAFGGTSFWIAPGLTARVYASGTEPDHLTARLGGVRETALAVGPLLSEGEDRRRWLQLGLACDVADAVATVIGRRRGDLSPVTTALCFATYTVSGLLTVAALRSVPATMPSASSRADGLP